MEHPKHLTPQHTEFPSPELALKDPDGLLAIGGSLAPQQLIKAYQTGIFPWFNEGEPILWWSPSIRTLLLPKQFKLHRSFKKILKQNFSITIDNHFQYVIEQCSQLRQNQQGTWITPEMIQAYCQLHQKGFAHSIEVWFQNKIVGGLYGLSLGHAFFGESMFHNLANASKIALFALCNLPLPFTFDFIDCQLPSAHLHSLGATDYPRDIFLRKLKKTLLKSTLIGQWQQDPLPTSVLLKQYIS